MGCIHSALFLPSNSFMVTEPNVDEVKLHQDMDIGE